MKSKSFNLKKWAKSRAGQQVFICIGFMIIPLLLLFLFTYFPFAEMIKFSFYKMKYTTPIDRREFVGWDNYLDVFRRKDCFGALKLSLFYMVGALIQLVLALYLATILSFKVKGGNLFKGLMFFPYLISGIAIGFIFKFFFTRGFVFDTILQWCGFQLENLPYWLKDQSVNIWSRFRRLAAFHGLLAGSRSLLGGGHARNRSFPLQSRLLWAYGTCRSIKARPRLCSPPLRR